MEGGCVFGSIPFPESESLNPLYASPGLKKMNNEDYKKSKCKFKKYESFTLVFCNCTVVAYKHAKRTTIKNSAYSCESIVLGYFA